jgi:hypothetical protein
MINDIIDGISVKLNGEFGDAYAIHSEDIKQDLIEPCFFIAFLNADQTQRLGKRYFKRHLFDIHYFPSSTTARNSEINGVSERLYEALEYITTKPDTVDESLLRGFEMNSETVDGVLHFFVSYNFHVNRVEVPADGMETVTVNNGLKG